MKQEGPWYYEQQDLGYNYRISDVQCALGISQLKKLDTFVAKRRAIAKRYDEAFASVDNIVTPKQLPAGKSSYHLYVIQVKNHDRRKVFEALREKGIGVNVHYIPVYQHPYYQQNGYESVICKEAQQLYEHMISLPIYPLLKEEEQEYVIQTVKELVQ